MHKLPNLQRCWKRLIRGLALLAGVTTLATACATPATVTSANNTAPINECSLPDANSLASVVRVYAENGEHSSGVIVASDRVITVAHGLPAGQRVFVGIGEQLRVATVLARHPSEDLAVLEVGTGATPVMPLASMTPTHNELVWAIGFPLGMEQRTSLGLFQGGSDSLLYSSAHINSGASGGALLSCEPGEVTGAPGRYTLAGVLKGFLAQPTADAIVNTGDSVAVSTLRIRELLELSAPMVAQNR